MSSTPNDNELLTSDKIPSIDTASNMGSDEDDMIRKSRSSIEDNGGYENGDSNEITPRSIWKKGHKLSSVIHTKITDIEQNNLLKPLPNSHYEIKQELKHSNSVELQQCSNPNQLCRRLHDHQVPNFVSKSSGNLNTVNRLFQYRNFLILEIYNTIVFRAPSLRHLPPKKQSLLTNHNHLHEQISYTYPSSTNNSHDYCSRCKILL